MSKMPAELKNNWIAALRSGEYKQCTGTMRDTDSSGEHSYCCLGVLQMVADGKIDDSEGNPRPALPIIRWYEEHNIEPDPGFEYSAGMMACDEIPIVIEVSLSDIKAFNLPTGRASIVDMIGGRYSLSALNDEVGLSFVEIANLVEKYVEGV
jgi:hypothetical protein